MKRAAGLAERRAGAAAPNGHQQARGYLNLHPRPDMGTQQGFHTLQYYYQLPDYVTFRDHKQLRPVALDETNTSEMTREEERVARLKTMNWRARMAADAPRDATPAWEDVREDGTGATQRKWSAAQAVEHQLRKGVHPTALTGANELAGVDPHGVMASANPLNTAWTVAPPARPPATSFRQLLQHGSTLNEMTSAYQQLCPKAAFPAAGLDFPAITQHFSVSLMDKATQSAGVTSHRAMLEYLKNLASACATSAPGDDFFGHMAVMAMLEGKADWFSSEWNHRLNFGEELSEASFAKLVAGYSKEGGRGFWNATVDCKEFNPDFVSHVQAMTKMSVDDVKAALPQLEAAFKAYGEVFAARLEREQRAGTRPPAHLATEEDWINIARDYFIAPYAAWAESGDPLQGYGEGDGSPEWMDEQDRLQAVLDMKIGEFLFSEWMRWEYIGQFVLADKLSKAAAEEVAAAAEGGEDDDGSAPPAAPRTPDLRGDVALASRLANYTIDGAFASLYADHANHVKATHRFLYRAVTKESETEAPPLFHFLRSLVNHSNIPMYNSGMGAGFALASRAVESYVRTGRFVGMPAVSPLSSHIADVTGVVGRSLVDSGSARDWSLPEQASVAREGVRRVVQAEAMLTALRECAPAAEARAEGLDLAGYAAQDAAAAIGHIRRLVQKDVEKQLRDPKTAMPDPEDVAVSDANTTWHAGSSRVITWKWRPTTDYAVKCPTAEQKSTALAGLIDEQIAQAEALDDPKTMAVRAVEKVETYGHEQDANLNPRGDRPEWPFTKLYLKKQHEDREKSFTRKFGVADDYPVKLVLYRKNTAGLAEMRRRREAVDAFINKHKGGQGEDARLAAMLTNIREHVVRDHVEQIAHTSGLNPVEAEVLRRLSATEELAGLLTSGTHLSEDAAAASDSLWEYQCDLQELADQSVSNTGRRRVRLPFARDGVTLEDGEYRVGVVGLAADGAWACEGVSPSFNVTNNVHDLVEEYAKSRRGGRPPLRELEGRRCLMPVDEVPALLAYLAAHQDTPLELDLALETRVGGDYIVLRTSSGPEAVVHLDVLKAQLAADYHREEAARDPVARAANLAADKQKALFTRIRPGATRKEYAKGKLAHDAACNENPGWWSHDAEAENPAMWKASKDVMVDPVVDHADRKAAGLFTNHATPLVNVRYEGLGYVSHLDISDVAPRMRVAVPVDRDAARESVELRDSNSNASVTLKLKDGKRLVAVVEGNEHAVPSVDFNEAKWCVELADIVCKLPLSAEGEAALGAVAALAGRAGLAHNIPAQVGLQLHHYAEICKEAINGAHTKHCALADAVSGRGAAVAAGKPLSQEDVLNLPTVVQSWLNAQSAHADAAPGGLKQYRRRFDSWHLNSGKGRYDQSPTKDEQWEHPYEENPVVYGFENTQQPFSSL